MSAPRLAVFVVSSLAFGLVSQTAVAQAQPEKVPQEIAADAQTQAPPMAQSGQAPAPVQQPAPPATAPVATPQVAEQPSAPKPEATFVSGFGTSDTLRIPKGSRLGIGATLGFTSGIGLSLRRHFDSGFGLQIGGFGIWTREHRHLNLATQALYTFYTGRWTRVYALAGVAWHVNQEHRVVEVPVQPNQDPNVDVPSRVDRYSSHSIYFGPGIGGELYLHRRFTVSLDIPLVFSIKQLSEKNAPPFEDRLSIHPGLNGSMHFYF